MTTMTSQALTMDEFYVRYSAYVDGFLARRSVLSASLFPEKPSQMYFGYLWVERAAGPITQWLDDRITATELGERFRALRTQGTALTVTGNLWTYLMGVLGKELTGQAWSHDDARRVLGYWQEVFAAFTARSDPASIVPERGGSYSRLHVLTPDQVQELTGALSSGGRDAVQGAMAAATNYSWLLECESRQGTFNHGLYDAGDGRRLLVKEFIDLSGRFYPWIDRSAADLPRGPVAIVLALRDVEARFDAFAVPSLEPESYDEHVEGVAVVTARGVEPDAHEWLRHLAGEIPKAHRSLFRTIMGWSARERFYGGALSYARIWADIMEAAGASKAEVDELVFASLDAFADEALDAHVARDEPAPIWPWVTDAERPSVFEPVLAALRADDDA